MAKFNFNLREVQSGIKPPKQKETPVNLVVRWNNNRLVFPSELTIFPYLWENDKTKGKKYQRAKTELKTHPEFNRRLDNLLATSTNVFHKFVSDNQRQPTINELRSELHKTIKPNEQNNVDLYKFFDKFIQEAEEGRRSPKPDKKYSPNTIKSYRYSFNYLKGFAKHKNRRIDFDNIDLDFYFDFTKYLSNVVGLSQNTLGKVIKVLKLVLNEATESGVNKNLAYKSKRFVASSEEVYHIYLNENELNALFKLDLSFNKSLERVRDLFYIGCVTGLRFSDLSTIKKGNIIGNELNIKTQKTGNSIVIPLEDEVFSIMERYDNSFPKSISNQKMNKYIKEICSLIPELKKPIETSITKGSYKVIENKPKYQLVTTHTCRRSFSSNSYAKGIPAMLIMAVTGHKTESSFFKYIKITPNEKAKMFKLYSDKSKNLKVV